MSAIRDVHKRNANVDANVTPSLPTLRQMSSATIAIGTHYTHRYTLLIVIRKHVCWKKRTRYLPTVSNYSKKNSDFMLYAHNIREMQCRDRKHEYILYCT